MTTKTTQSRHPWRATLRTVFAGIIALAAIWGLIVEAMGIDAKTPLVALTLAVAGGITRVMALPQVEAWLKKFLPFLSAEPKPNDVTTGSGNVGIGQTD